MLEWLQRAKVSETPTSNVRRYYTRDRRFVVVESKNKFGLPLRWYAIHRFHKNGVDGEKIISIHRKKHRAVQACEKFAAELEE